MSPADSPGRAADDRKRQLDTGRDASDIGDVRITEGRERDSYWAQATNTENKQQGIVEGSLDSGRLTIHRAEVEHGAEGESAATRLAEHVHEKHGKATIDGTTPNDGTRRDVRGFFKDFFDRKDTPSVDSSDMPTEVRDVRSRPDISEKYPSEYAEATPADKTRLESSRSESDDPRHWIADINPGRDQPPDKSWPRGASRDTNCTDCARSVQDTLDGKPSVAAAGPPESDRRTEAWAGAEYKPTTYSDLEKQLSQPGDSAVCAMRREWGPGHAFNAVNIDGKVCYVDGQAGVVGDWPPKGLESETVALRAIVFHRGSR